jgi:hypothetical protein
MRHVGLWLRSSRAQRGVAVDAAHVLWSRVWRVGSWSWSSRAWRGAAVAVDAACVSRSRSSCVSSSRVQRVGSRSRVAAVTLRALWLSPLRCMWCRCRPFRAAWGVAGAFVASGVVLRRPQEGQRRGGQEGCGDVALAAGKGATGWGHARVVVVVGNDRAGLLRQFFVECRFVITT